MLLRVINIIIIISIISGCTASRPMFFDVRIPEGPPAYKAGWHDGCRSSFSTKGHANSTFSNGNGPTFSPILTHDPQYQTGWSHALFTCATATGVGSYLHPFRKYPFQ